MFIRWEILLILGFTWFQSPPETGTQGVSSPNKYIVLNTNPPPLHGQFEALAHRRTFTFWNSGRFESSLHDHLNGGEIRGMGTYSVEGDLLKLQFEQALDENGPATWEPRHFEQMVVKLGGAEGGRVDHIMTKVYGDAARASKEVPNDVPAECGSPDWHCWRLTDRALPMEEIPRN